MLTFLLLLVGCSYVMVPQPAAAAAKTEMYVNAKGDIILRSSPNQHAERLGTIKNHSKVTVLSSSNGWSYVQAGKSKGYVYTSALSKHNPKAPTTVTGGLSPVHGLILTYSPSFIEDGKETFHVRKEGEYTQLYNKNSPNYPHFPSFTYYESKNGFGMGVSHSDFIFVDVPYPLRQGTYTTDWSYMAEKKVLVESTTKTIKVKAGSFRNVVILRHPDGSREYLAKGVGIIKSTDVNGKAFTELAAVKQGK